jgi:hypothetical protein
MTHQQAKYDLCCWARSKANQLMNASVLIKEQAVYVTCHHAIQKPFVPQHHIASVLDATYVYLAVLA